MMELNLTPDGIKTVGELRKALEMFTDECEILLSRAGYNYADFCIWCRVCEAKLPARLIIQK